MWRPFSNALVTTACHFINALPHNENSISSTLSGEIVLTMLDANYRLMERSFAILQKVDQKKRCSSFSYLIPCLNSVDGVTLNITTRIYLKEGAKIKPKVMINFENVFDLSLEHLDFGEQQACADIINEWVAQQTKNVIRDILSPKVIGDKTCMVLINAIHFKGNWLTPFEIEETKCKKFHVNEITTVQVPQMFKSRAFVTHGFSRNFNATLLGMYYKGTQSCMVIVLPQEKYNSLKKMLNTMASGKVFELMDDIKAMEWTTMDVTLPKFKAEVTINAKNFWQKFNLEAIFHKEASYIDMLTSSNQQFVSDAFQKAFIEVDEAGTEGAGADCWPVMEETCPRRSIYFKGGGPCRSGTGMQSYPSPQFVADRPFLFLLLVHGIPVFAGTYRGPQEIVQAAQNLEDDDPEVGHNKTTICSPVSAQITLGMLALGCKDQSYDELVKALDISSDQVLRSSFGNITSNLKSIEGATLNTANKIYLKNNETVKPEIKKDFEEVFKSGLEQLDFEDKEASANMINEWVAQQTNHLIRDIVSADMFDQNTSIVLVNAIHFKGDWFVQFMKEYTEDKDFHVNRSTTIKVPQMYEDYVYMNFGVSSTLQAKILQMYYRGGESSMVIVLPDEIEGLNRMLQQLASGYDLMADIEGLKCTKIDMSIPKFKAEMTINLKELLPKLGVKSIFDQNSSDINMLTSNKRLFVSEAVQKAYIDVNEAGTEAAAATMPVMKECCLSSNPQFIADHPFLYLLLVKGVPIFVGTFYGPQS